MYANQPGGVLHTSAVARPASPCILQMFCVQFMAAVNSGRRQQLQQRKVSLMQEYARADGDVGSPEVQSECSCPTVGNT
jgi:hypothetical protein